MGLPGPKPKGATVGKNIGGYLNVRLGKEGAPIYMDQSPSYLYKDPPIERNQNGVPLPRPSPSIVTGKYKFEDELQANFIRPSNDAMVYQKNRKLGTNQSFNTDTLGAKDVHRKQNSPYLQLPVEKEEVNKSIQNLHKIKMQLRNSQIQLEMLIQNQKIFKGFQIIEKWLLKIQQRIYTHKNLLNNLLRINLIQKFVNMYEKFNNIMSNNINQDSLSFNLRSQNNNDSQNPEIIDIQPQEFSVKENLFESQNQQTEQQENSEHKRYKKGDNIKDYAKEIHIEKKQKQYNRGLNRYDYQYRNQDDKIINVYDDILNQHICPICRNKFKEKKVNQRYEQDNIIKFTRECGHNFCQLCIDKLDKNCPICKTKINSSNSVKNRIFKNNYFEEKDFLCPNCNFPFDTDLRKPILLTNCGHTFCLYCIEMNQKRRKVFCTIDETETHLEKLNIYENRLFREDIEKKQNEDIKKIKDTESGNVYYCMTHYVPIKQDNNLYHQGSGHLIISNDDVDQFISTFQKEYDIQEQQIYKTFQSLGDLEFRDLYSEYDDLKKAMIDSRVEFQNLDKNLKFIDNQQHLQYLTQYLEKQFSSKFQKDQMNKFWNNAKEISFLKKQTNEIFEKMKEYIEKCNTKPEKIYQLPNLFILFFKLEKIRQNLCKKYQFLFGSFMYNTPAVDSLLNLLDDSKKKMNNTYDKLARIKDSIEKAMKNIKKISGEHDDFLYRVQKQKKKFESTKFVQDIKKNFHSYFQNPKYNNEERINNVGFEFKNIIEKTLDNKKNILEEEQDFHNQSTIEKQEDNLIQIKDFKDKSFIKEQESVIDQQWQKLYEQLEKFGTDNLFNTFKNNNKVLKFLRFR